jgi:cytoskeletal protein CcmA (bactofilin family)
MIFKRKTVERRPAPASLGDSPSQVAAEPSFIGQDARFQGNIVTQSEIHIDGTVDGSVQAHTCLVDRNGEVNGSISAQFVVVRGRVLGPITATQVTIQKGAHVEGEVMHEGLSIEHGAYVMGTITQGGASTPQGLANSFGGSLFQPRQQAPSDEDLPADESNLLQLKSHK